MSGRRIVRLDRVHRRRGPESQLWGAIYREDSGHLRLRLSQAAATRAGGSGWYAIAVETAAELVLLRTSNGSPMAVYLDCGRRCSCGAIARAEPWLHQLVGWAYPAEPVQGGLRLDLTEPLRRVGRCGETVARSVSQTVARSVARPDDST